MTVSLTLREEKGTELTWAELDGNFVALVAALGDGYGRTRTLYDYPGHAVGGNCVTAMNNALADTDCDTIIVPDGVTLGVHVFDSARKTIIGGKNVTFSGNGAGLYPRVCDFVRITGFRDAVLPTFPMTGGTIANGATFVATPAGHNIGTLIIDNNTTSGGKNGVAVGPEGGSGQIRNMVIIMQNWFANLGGVEPGSGYGIQYANELLTGVAYIANNLVDKSSRVGIYIARNAGESPVYLYNNVVRDHRINATNKGDGPFCAFDVVRASNVHGYGNQSIRPFDGSMLIGPEFEPPAALNSRNISWRDFTIDSPANSVPQIFCGYIDDPDGNRIDGITFDGINMTSTRIAPVFDYSYGKRVTVKNVLCRYVGITSGAYYPIILKGKDTADSGDITFENIRVVGQGNTGADLVMFEMAGAILTNDIRLVVKDISYDSDSTNRKFWNPQAPISNARIEAYQCGTTGIVWSGTTRWYKGVNPSIQTVGRILNIGQLTPNGFVTPEYQGEIILATDTKTTWQAGDTTNTGWICTGRFGAGLNTFVAGAAGAIVSEGKATSTSTATFPLNAVGPTRPNTITLVNTFYVTDAAGATVSGSTGNTPTLDTARSSRCLAFVNVTGMSGLTIGQPVYLNGTADASAITVNY